MQHVRSFPFNPPMAANTTRYSFLCFAALAWLSACSCDKSSTATIDNMDCVDRDGDGYGENCSLGLDCNDDNPAQGNREICSPSDGVDNNCNGQIDEQISPACGCDATCGSDGSLGTNGSGFDVSKGSSDSHDGVGTDDLGRLELSSRALPETPYIWIVNSGVGTVSKFSTKETNANGTFKELARYWSGPHGAANDPSRTTVNTSGDVFVGNRGGWGPPNYNSSATPNGNVQTVTKISGTDCNDADNNGTIEPSECSRAGCIDRNNNGKIDTSSCHATGSCTNASVLAWGEDECVLWSQELYSAAQNYGVIRSMAAQDIPGADGAVTEYVWAGSWGTSGTGSVWRLDGSSKVTANKIVYGLNDADTKVILRTDSPVRPYGFALDANAQLWISSRAGNLALGRVDTSMCVSNSSCNNVNATCNNPGEGDPYDTCVKQKIPTPKYNGSFVLMYGITVDRDQNIWLAGSSAGVFRYRFKDPAPTTAVVFDNNCHVNTASRWGLACVIVSNGLAGIAVDGLGFVYAGGQSDGVHILPVSKFDTITQRSDINSTNYYKMPGTFGSGRTNYGVAVDTSGRIWSINVGNARNTNTDDFATVIEPTTSTPPPSVADFSNTTFALHTVTTGQTHQSAVGLAYPYTYSDMTGVQLRLASNRFGYYSHIFEGCKTEGGSVSWQKLVFDAFAPPGTRVRWFARGAASMDALQALDFTSLGDYPTNESPFSLKDFKNLKFLEIRLELVVDSVGFGTPSPVVSSFEPTYTCGGQVAL